VTHQPSTLLPLPVPFRPLLRPLRLAALGFLSVGLAALSPTDARAGVPQASQVQVASPGQAAPPATDPQSGTPPSAAAAQTAPAATQSTQDPDDDRIVPLAEPDYRLVNLATTLRLPSHRMSFDMTHRFTGNLMSRSFADNASNLFGLDDGAAVGLELRYAVARHIEAAVYRTNIDKTIQLYTKIDAIHQHGGTPLSLSAQVSIEGTSNFHTNYQPGLSLILSRAIADRLAIYAEPTWVARTGIIAGLNQGTGFVGVGARARVGRRTYLVAEVSPRFTEYAPGPAEFGFGLEERVGGHVFQLNFTNTTSTTLGQVARGGLPSTLFLGLNLSRKFF
jgi:hypothetical protein